MPPKNFSREQKQTRQQKRCLVCFRRGDWTNFEPVFGGFSGSLGIFVANLFCYSFLPVKEKNNQSVHRPSQGAAAFFAVSDDLKQQVSKVQGIIYNNLRRLHFNLQS